MKIRNSAYIIRLKYWNIDDDPEFRVACIPYLLQNDEHTAWDKSHYPFRYLESSHVTWNGRYPL